MVVLVALSSLFWSIAGTIRDERLTLAVFVDIAPFVVSVMSFAMAASALYSVYLSKYGPRDMHRNDGGVVEALPHILALILILVVADAASIVTIGNSFQSNFSLLVGLFYFMVFSFAFVFFLLIAYYLIAQMREPRDRSTSMESGPDSTPAGESSMGRVLYSTASLYLIIGVLALCLAWNMNAKIMFFLLAVQSSGVLILIFFVFERVDSLLREFHNLHALREERSIAVHEGLRNTEFGDRYLNLPTVELEIREPD